MGTKVLVELADPIFSLQFLKMEVAGSSIILITIYKTGAWGSVVVKVLCY
jgi:hypothetical protein